MNVAIHNRTTSTSYVVLLLLAASSPLAAAEPVLFEASLTIEVEHERAGLRGALFEIYDESGNVLAGAGFPGVAKNQRERNRPRLELFVRGTAVQDAREVLSAEVNRPKKPITLRFAVTPMHMKIWREDQLLASREVSLQPWDPDRRRRIVWGRGGAGQLRAAVRSRHSTLDRVYLGSYVNLGHEFGNAKETAAREAAIERMLDRFQASGLEVVMPYITTTSGAANYPSKIISQHTYGEWDPLRFLIAQARQRRLQVYPVFCVLACGHEHPQGILATHPEWSVRHPDGHELGYICPTHRAARDWVTSTVAEVIHEYEVDGILLDYLRYPNRPMRLDPASEAQFNLYRDKYPERAQDELLQSFREAGLTALARQISKAVRRQRNDLQIAIYSWGPHVASNHRVAQPWPRWSREGLIDMVNISGYCYPDNYGEKYLEVFSRRIGDAVRLNQSHHGLADVTFCLGTATSHGKVTAASQIDDYLRLGAEQRVRGVAVFTWSTLAPFLSEVERQRYLTNFKNRLGKPE